ncbi:unnamed protein product, partial [Heterotrigona itama]
HSTAAIDEPFLNPGGRSPFIHALSFFDCLAFPTVSWKIVFTLMFRKY